MRGNGGGGTASRRPCAASQAPQACNTEPSLVVVKCGGGGGGGGKQPRSSSRSHSPSPSTSSHRGHNTSGDDAKTKRKKKKHRDNKKKKCKKNKQKPCAPLLQSYRYLPPPPPSSRHHRADDGSGFCDNTTDAAYAAWLVEYQQYVHNVHEHYEATKCCAENSGSSDDCSSSDNDCTTSSDDDDSSSNSSSSSSSDACERHSPCSVSANATSACEQARQCGETNPVVRALECGLCEPQRIITQRNRAPPRNVICDPCDRFLFWIEYNPETDDPHCCHGYPAKKAFACRGGDRYGDSGDGTCSSSSSSSEWSSSSSSSFSDDDNDGLNGAVSDDDESDGGNDDRHRRRKAKKACCKPVHPFKNGHACVNPKEADAKVWLLGPDHKYTRYTGTFRSLIRDTVINTDTFRTGATPCALTHKHDPCEQVWVDDRLNVLVRALTGGYYLDSSVEPQPEFPCPQDRTVHFDTARQLKFQWCHGIWYVIEGGKCCAPVPPPCLTRGAKLHCAPSPFQHKHPEPERRQRGRGRGKPRHRGSDGKGGGWGRGKTRCCG